MLVPNLGITHDFKASAKLFAFVLRLGLIQKRDRQMLRSSLNMQVMQAAANIRALRPPSAYKGKGIRYTDEVVKLKTGKKK